MQTVIILILFVLEILIFTSEVSSPAVCYKLPSVWETSRPWTFPVHWGEPWAVLPGPGWPSCPCKPPVLTTVVGPEEIASQEPPAVVASPQAPMGKGSAMKRAHVLFQSQGMSILLGAEDPAANMIDRTAAPRLLHWREGKPRSWINTQMRVLCREKD